MTRKIARKSRILQIEEAKLKLFEKNGKEDKHFQFQKWFLENAKLYKNVDREQSIQVCKIIHGQIKNCYYNCWRAVNDHTIEGLTYCEGFELNYDISIPLEHCWLIDSRGNVIDPTLIINGKEFAQQMEKYGKQVDETSKDRIGNEYYGITYTKEQVNKFALSKKETGIYLYDLFKEVKGL